VLAPRTCSHVGMTCTLHTTIPIGLVAVRQPLPSDWLRFVNLSHRIGCGSSTSPIVIQSSARGGRPLTSAFLHGVNGLVREARARDRCPVSIQVTSRVRVRESSKSTACYRRDGPGNLSDEHRHRYPGSASLGVSRPADRRGGFSVGGRRPAIRRRPPPARGGGGGSGTRRITQTLTQTGDGQALREGARSRLPRRLYLRLTST
jgi:hypothetical protein